MWCKCAYAQNATMPITNQINIVYDSFCGKTPCSAALGELQQHLEQTYELKAFSGTEMFTTKLGSGEK